jgi:hypothetical protein
VKRATSLSALSSLGTVAGIILNLLIGSAGDHGLIVTGLSMGLGLMVLSFIARGLI